MKIKFGFLILFAFLIFWGCATTPPPKPEPEPFEKIPEPVRLNENMAMQLLALDAEMAKARNTEDISVMFSDSVHQQEVEGFRVQIFTTDDSWLANYIFQMTDLMFPHQIYLIYDAPDYKIRIGDLLTRDDALKLKEVAEAHNFPNSWVMRGKVLYPPTEKDYWIGKVQK